MVQHRICCNPFLAKGRKLFVMYSFIGTFYMLDFQILQPLKAVFSKTEVQNSNGKNKKQTLPYEK